MTEQNGRSGEPLRPREQFTFYRSFADALRMLRDPAERCAVYDAICDYALNLDAPVPADLPATAAMAFALIRPILDAGRRKAELRLLPLRQPQEEPEPGMRKRGQFGWVCLSDRQFERLERDLGAAELQRCIAYVDELAQSTGNKNRWRDWNLVLRRCSRENWGRRGGQEGGLNKQYGMMRDWADG